MGRISRRIFLCTEPFLRCNVFVPKEMFQNSFEIHFQTKSDVASEK